MFLLVCLVWPAWSAGTELLSAGQQAFENGDYGEAEGLWRRAAERGDAQACFRLGALFDQGLVDGAPDHDRAFHWYELAALQGHPQAGFNLGNAYKHGRGAIQSDTLANYWWQKSSEAGVAEASYNLAIQHYRGLGTARDLSEATRLFNLAAVAGHAGARGLIASAMVKSVPVNDATEREPGSDENRKMNSAAWLKGQPPAHYTIQVGVFKNVDTVPKFLRDHGLEDEASMVLLGRDDGALLHVLVGSFANRKEAQARLERLSNEIPGAGAWLRQFGDLQDFLPREEQRGQSVKVPD